MGVWSFQASVGGVWEGMRRGGPGRGLGGLLMLVPHFFYFIHCNFENMKKFNWVSSCVATKGIAL